MKTLTFLAFLVLLAATLPLSLRAELLVYRETERARVTGNTREVTVPVTTYVVHDMATETFSGIGAFRVGPGKFYAITNASRSHTVTHGIIGRLGSYAVLSRVSNSNDSPDVIMSAYFAKGRETSLNIGRGRTVTFPRALQAVTRSIQFSSGQLATYESSSTVVFQSTETKTANEAGDTPGAVIERIRQRLEAQGYVTAQ